MIPRNIKAIIDLYVDKGYSVGSFLYAVLTNDLFEATARADQQNQFALTLICQYIYNYTPKPCWGSPEAVKDWQRMHKEHPNLCEAMASQDRERRQKYYEESQETLFEYCTKFFDQESKNKEGDDNKN